MPIQFQCERCGETIRLSRKHAGRKGRCAACGVVLRVPQDAPEVDHVRSDDLPPFAAASGSDADRPGVGGGGPTPAAPAVEPPARVQLAAPSPAPPLPPAGLPGAVEPEAAQPGAPTRSAPRPRRRDRRGSDEDGERPRRPRRGGLAVPLLAGALLLVSGLLGLTAWVALQGGLPWRVELGAADPPAVTPTPGGSPDERPFPSEAELRAGLRELREALARLPEDPAARRLELARLERLRAALTRSPAPYWVAEPLGALQAELAALPLREERGPPAATGTPAPTASGAASPAGPPVDRAERLRALLADSCVRRAQQALDRRGSFLVRGARACFDRDPARLLRSALEEARGRGLVAVSGLLLESRWHGVLGLAAYQGMLEDVRTYRELLGVGDAVLAAFEQGLKGMAALARAWEVSTSVAEYFLSRGELETARRVLAGDDPWFQAARAYLTRPEVVAAVTQLGREATAPEGEGPEADAAGSTRARSLGALLDWRGRFASLTRSYRQAEPPARAECVEELGHVLEEARLEAERSLEDCLAVLDAIEPQRRLFEQEPALAPVREALHRSYFERAFLAASGPRSFGALDRWCQEHGREAWRAQLRPFLEAMASAAAPAQAARERARQLRAESLQAAAEWGRERLEQVEEGLAELLGWMQAEGCAPEGLCRELDELLARAVERAGDVQGGARLRAQLAGLKPGDRSPSDARALERKARQRLARLIDRVVARTLKAVDRCLEAGELGLGYELFSYVLLLDPENDRAHRGLGHKKVEGRWLRRYEAEQLKRGLAWDDRFGWVRPKDLPRWEAGEAWDPERKEWAAERDVDRRHSDPRSPWLLETEHFRLRSTAPLRRTVAVAARLEAFYLQMFRHYDRFFAEHGGAALVFGVAPSQTEPLEVWFYASRQQFQAEARPDPGVIGYYDPARRASFFFDQEQDYSTLQHEVTHQILGETARGQPGRAPTWLKEGAAVYLQGAEFEDGVLRVSPDPAANGFVGGYAAGLARGSELSFTSLLGRGWGGSLEEYRAAGALVHLLCELDGGRYRGDLVDFLRAAYHEEDPPSLEEVLGLSGPALDLLGRHWFAGRGGSGPR